MKITFLLYFFCLSILLSAQPEQIDSSFHSPSTLEFKDYIPLIAKNKYWFYKVHNGADANPPFIGEYVLYLGADTSINNTNYSRLLKSHLKGSNPCQFGPCFVPYIPYQLADTITQGYLREDLADRKVYFLPANNNSNYCSQDEYLVYDFNLALNDSLPSCLTHIVTADLVIDSIKKAIINKVEVKSEYNADRVVWHFNGVYQVGLNFTNEMKLIEGVGIDFYNGFYNSPNTLFNNFCEGSLNECNILSNSKEPRLEKINIYPNPFTNELYIDTDAAVSNVSVTNALGQLVYKGNEVKQIDLSNQASGMYYIAFTANGIKQVYSVVKH